MGKKYTLTQEVIKDYVLSEAKRLDLDISEDEAFGYISIQQILTQYQIDDDETRRGIVDGGGDGGYDGIYIFVNGVLVNGEDYESLDIGTRSRVDIHLIQAKNQTGFKEVILQNWKDSFTNLMGGAFDYDRYNSNVIDLFSLIRGILTKAVSLRLQINVTFWAISLAEEVHINVKKQADELKKIAEAIVPAKNTSVEVHFVTASELYSLIGQSADEILTLKGTKEPLCPDDASAILTVKLRDYFEFISDDKGELNKTLFEANIRDYQGKVEVNKAIKRTLDNRTDVDFWWLNNGITIVADEVTRDMSNSITLTNPRIVNGLQTSNEISRYCQNSESEPDERKVLVKCIASNDQETRARIIQATNNQTTIPPAYLHSLEIIHLQIERYFKSRGLHYDRRKSSGKNNGIPTKDIIAIPFLGQCLIATLLQQPDYARARPSQILGDKKKYERIFNNDIPIEAYYRLAKLSLFIRQYIRHASLTGSEQNDLIFHILLIVCSRQAGSFDISPADLAQLSVPDESELLEIVNKVKLEYLREGGTSQVAKSSGFVSDLISSFSTEWGWA